MLTASQDIDNFIDGQRSKTNKPSNRQETNRQQAVPPPPTPCPPPIPSQSIPLNNSNNQSDIRMSQIFDGSPPAQTQQSYHSSSIGPFTSNSFVEYQQGPGFGNNDPHQNSYSFFDRFGTHEVVRARLNNDLKREYNEYLQSLQNMAKRKVDAQMDGSQGSTTRRVQFQQNQMFPSSRQQQQTDRRSIHNSMNDISSSRSGFDSQSMNDLSTGRTVHNVHSMNDLSSTMATELAANRARARLLQHQSEQYIRDREEYILELYEQIYELESRIRQLEKESRKLTVTNSTSATRSRYAEDLSALNALLAERLNQRVAVDHELTEILNRPPVDPNGRRVFLNSVSTTTTNVPVPPIFEISSPRNEQTPKPQMYERQLKNISEHQHQFQSPRAQQQQLLTGRPSTPQYARGNVFNGIYGTFKTEAQVVRQERYKQDLLLQIEEKRLRDAAELARRRAAEERERAQELERQRLLEKQMAEEALRKQQLLEEERRRQQLLADEAERLRRQEELERQRKEEELERQRMLEELERQRREEELERQRRLDELERQRRQDELDRQKKLTDEERKRREEEAERRRQQFELDRQKRKEEEEERRRREELERQRREELERRRREEAELERQRRRAEEEERRRREEEDAEERRRREAEEEEERRRREEEWKRNAKVERTDSSSSFRRDGSDSDVFRRLLQLKRQLKDKENRLKDTITTDSTRYTNIVDYSTAPYLPPPGPFYLERKESSDDLLDVARIHYRDAPLTHDILLNVLQTADGEEFHPRFLRDDATLMHGIADGKRFNSAEHLALPKRPDLTDELFSTNLGNAASHRRFGDSLPSFRDDDPLSTADRELNRIARKSDRRLVRLRHVEQGDPVLFDSDDLLDRFQDKQRLEKQASHTHLLDEAWLK